MLIQEGLNLQQKLEILTDAAKYDVACTSSGIDRKGQAGSMGNAAACGICHCFAADGRCISLLKILMTNACIYDCRYCINRVSNDTVRTAFTPEEICQLTMEFYRRNYIEGLFLSSGIMNSPNETMEQICKVLLILRERYHFRGYIHVKAIPGADPSLIEQAGLLADRMSVNLELPTGEGLKKLAPAKTREKILNPMRQIQKGIYMNQSMLEDTRQDSNPRALTAGRMKKQKRFSDTLPAQNRASLENMESSTSISSLNSDAKRQHISDSTNTPALSSSAADILTTENNPVISTTGNSPWISTLSTPPSTTGSRILQPNARFVPAGQSTQMIIGATQETDHQILSVTEALYRNFQLKRVFFSAYTALNEDSRLPDPDTPPPLKREHRLYQADWLLRYYGFAARELLTEDKPFFNLDIDPKCDWAIRHLEDFPVEVTTADMNTLLRVPGIGVTSAKRILKARRYGTMDFNDLKKFGVVLKRAGFFITCHGKTCHPLRFEEDYLTRQLTSTFRDNKSLPDSGGYTQLSLFDFGLTNSTTVTGGLLS